MLSCHLLHFDIYLSLFLALYSLNIVFCSITLCIKYMLLFILSRFLSAFTQELFVRLVPYHCLGSLWSQRDKKGREGVCWSVRATVRQFNKLANAVLASCLWHTKLRSQQRARLLEKWISVAEVSYTKSQGHSSKTTGFNATNTHFYKLEMTNGVRSELKTLSPEVSHPSKVCALCIFLQ